MDENHSVQSTTPHYSGSLNTTSAYVCTCEVVRAPSMSSDFLLPHDHNLQEFQGFLGNRSLQLALIQCCTLPIVLDMVVETWS